MNILNALKQLRDDIKAWVTTNLNALNAKIDAKTVPIDSELSTTSTNPVQNKTITNAINNIPRFSGDYNDLTNAPNIAEDDSGNMIIADESGNIIFKADADGIHTTALSLNGECAATEAYVDEAVANIDIPEVDFTGYATEDFVTDAVESAKEELGESIVSESEDWKVVDEAGNIIFSVDAEGAHTTNLTLNSQSVEDIIDERVAVLVDSAPEALNTLNELAAALGDDPNFATTVVSQIGSIDKRVDAVSNLIGDLPVNEQINNAIEAIEPPEIDLANYYTKEETNASIESAKQDLSESIVAESEEWKVVDNNGNIIFSVDADGAHTTELTLNGESLSDLINNRDADTLDGRHAEDFATSVELQGVSNAVQEKTVVQIITWGAED